MTMPQPRRPGATYFITARCERRECRLPPTEETSAAVAVALVDALERYRLTLTAISVPNNHLHMVVHDPGGRVSEFLRDMKALIARFGNARDGVNGFAFWDRQQAVCIELGDPDTVIEKVAYTMANPVTSFLVERLDQWPGLLTRVEDLGRWRGPIYRRPGFFFRTCGPTSEVVEVASELPPMLASLGPAEVARRVRARMDELMKAARDAAATEGHGFVGVKQLLANGVWHRPSSPSQRSSGEAAKALPRVAAATPARKRAMLDALIAFQQAHRRAWEAFRRGLAVVFPAGTFKAWRFYGARRAELPPGAYALTA